MSDDWETMIDEVHEEFREKRESANKLKKFVSRCMAMAYGRGLLDGSGMPDCQEKENKIRRYADKESERWEAGASALISIHLSDTGE